MPPAPTLLWFRRDLRTHDQPLFDLPASTPVLGVWVLDPRELLTTDPLGFPRCGDRRLRFLLESVADLRQRLRELGADLLVRIGEPETVLPQLMDELHADTLRAVRHPGTEERGVEKRLRKRVAAGRTFELLDPDTLFESDDPLADARDLPEVFSKYRRTMEKKRRLAEPRPRPARLSPWPTDHDPGELPTFADLGRTEPAPDPRAADDRVTGFTGGETAGCERLHAWAFAGDHLRHYKHTRNGLLGDAFSSKLSPWLALGCLSARYVAAETLRYESERVANDSTYWLRFELMWADYFRLALLKHGPRAFRRAGPAGSDLRWDNPPDHFEAWREARTGVDFIDANLVELEATGFMSNRGRQNVASFLTKNLNVDWRWGARWFESRLLDYEPAANYGNWAYAAGVGADPRGFRGFDVLGQAHRYDPDGAHADFWLHGPDDAFVPPRPKGGPIVNVRNSLADAERRWQAAG